MPVFAAVLETGHLPAAFRASYRILLHGPGRTRPFKPMSAMGRKLPLAA